MEFNLSPIKQFELLSADIPDVVSLAQGIPSFNTPTEIRHFVADQMMKGDVSKYSLTYGLAELRETIALDMKKDGMDYNYKNEIIATSGAIEAISATLATVLQPGDEVILPVPTYTSYFEAVKLARGVPVPVFLDDNFDLNIENIKKAITKKTKALLFCNPNNPTGKIFSVSKIKELGKLAKKHNFYVLSDEVYQDITFSRKKIVSLATFPQFRENLIRIFSFSKSFAMTGWRLGYIATHKKLADEIIKRHDAMNTCAPVISQYAGIAALNYQQPIIDRFNDIYAARRQMVNTQFKRLKKYLDFHLPEAAYFFFPKYKLNIDSWTLCEDILKKAKVTLVPGVAFGENAENHFRLSFGRSEQDLEIGLARLIKYFEEEMFDKKWKK